MEQDFAETMRSLGAREFQLVALRADEVRAMAAVAEAQRRGVNAVIPYALTLFDDPSWTPKDSRTRPVALTNLSVDRKCAHCGGDRFVLVTDGPGLYETYAPCRECNAGANTEFWTARGEKHHSVPQ